MAAARFLLSDEVLCVARRALSSETGGVVAIISIGIELHQAIHLHYLMACGISIIWQTTYHGPAAQLAQPFDEANTRYSAIRHDTIITHDLCITLNVTVIESLKGSCMYSYLSTLDTSKILRVI